MAVAHSPAVKLRISIKDTKVPAHEEVIQRSEKGYEVVNVDGLVFRRKMRKLDDARRVSLADQQATPAESSGRPTSLQNTPDRAVAVPPAQPLRTPLKEISTDQADDERRDPVQNTSVGLPDVQDDVAMPSNDAQALSVEQQDNQKEQADYPEAADPQSEQQFKPAESMANELMAKIPEGILESEKLLSLCQHLAQSVQESSFWGTHDQPESSRLLQSAIDKFREGILEALQNGTLICSDPVSVKSSAADVQKLQLAAKKKSLQQQLQRFKKEEDDWNAVLHDMAASFVPVEEQMVNAEDIAAPETLQTQLPEDESQAQARLTLQVDGLCAMMNGAEEVLSKAEHLCKVMQAEYHREKFMTFPHINSPAKLIHEIVRPRHSRFMPASNF